MKLPQTEEEANIEAASNPRASKYRNFLERRAREIGLDFDDHYDVPDEPKKNE